VSTTRHAHLSGQELEEAKARLAAGRAIKSRAVCRSHPTKQECSSSPQHLLLFSFFYLLFFCLLSCPLANPLQGSPLAVPARRRDAAGGWARLAAVCQRHHHCLRSRTSKPSGRIARKHNETSTHKSGRTNAIKAAERNFICSYVSDKCRYYDRCIMWPSAFKCRGSAGCMTLPGR
jgi:hypothetical protein